VWLCYAGPVTWAGQQMAALEEVVIEWLTTCGLLDPLIVTVRLLFIDIIEVQGVCE
jgi:hypothetical protein